MGRIQVCVSLFIVSDSVRVAGRGLIEILEAIEEEGSVRSAAKRLGINYRRLWTRISRAEKLLGVKLVEASARGSRLTDSARRLIEAFRELENRVGSLCVDTGIEQ